MEEVEVMEADEEDGSEMVETVDEVEDLCRSMGDGLSFWVSVWCGVGDDSLLSCW